MSYFYHMIPSPFIGTELIPLNQMDKEGTVYKEHSRKYVGREDLKNQNIPILDCLWNDVVQFSALDPQIIVNSLKKIQPDLKLSREKYFKISIDEVEGVYDGVIFDRKKDSKRSYKISNDEVQILNKVNYTELTEVPIETTQFWENAIKNNTPVLWFPYITHIFLKSKIDTSNFEICTIEQE